MHVHRVVAGQDVGRVAVALEQLSQLVLGDARQDGRVGDLIAVQVQDRDHHAVADRVEEFVRVPAGGQRPGLGFAVADHAENFEVRIVEGRAISVCERIPKLATFVNGAGGFRRIMAGNAARKRELPKEFLQAGQISRHAGVDFGVGSLEVGVRHHRRTAVSRAADEDGIEVAGLDDPVEMDVEEVESGRGAPVPEQTGFDVLKRQRLAQQRVVQQIDLANGEVVRRAPVGVQLLEFALVQRSFRHRTRPFRLRLHNSTIRDAASSRSVASRTQSVNSISARNSLQAKGWVHWRRDEEIRIET